ncbi:lactosylceramide 4-alpha-galactosyltransferase [Ixodes scapularis]|uniref:lactosylceramide 4-alpha-galactosyltransferase n=1 Tax=Ixodes scapularis TaxID=6945 RepID=UPI001C3852A8|nr:lactosylceramide 4-alpha-galactosyltransferase [Ixodes scapularis]
MSIEVQCRIAYHDNDDDEDDNDDANSTWSTPLDPLRRKKCSMKGLVAVTLTVGLLTLITTGVTYPSRNVICACQSGENAILTDRDLYELTKSGRNFFFLETAGSTCLNSRQSCSIESAARQNPEFTIFLLTLWGTRRCRYLDHLKSLRNFRLARIDVNSLVNDTPLNGWYHSDAWIVSPFRTNHFSDALRLLVLWKYGGVYADLDTLVLKSVANLQNSVSRERFPLIGNSMMSFQKGHPFLLACLQEFAINYKPRRWAYNGPRLLERVLKTWCPKEPVMQQPYVDCADVSILPGEAFYPVSYTEWKLPFQASEASHVAMLLSNSYAIHLWNALSKITRIEEGSAYDVLQKNACSTTYELSLSK